MSMPGSTSMGHHVEPFMYGTVKSLEDAVESSLLGLELVSKLMPISGICCPEGGAARAFVVRETKSSSAVCFSRLRRPFDRISLEKCIRLGHRAYDNVAAPGCSKLAFALPHSMEVRDPSLFQHEME